MTREEAIKQLTINRPSAYTELREAIDIAIKALKPKPMQKFDNVKQHIDRLAGDYKCWDERLSHKEALELSRMLEQEPCEDAISREVVQKWYCQNCCGRGKHNCSYYPCNEIKDILNLPSVTPQLENIHVANVHFDEEKFKEICKNAPLTILDDSNTPTLQQKLGKWLYDKTIENWRCSECNETPRTMGYVGTADFMAEHFRFCNHCGMKMEVSGNE